MDSGYAAFHGDALRRDRFRRYFRAHLLQDQLVRGTYGAVAGPHGWQGCSVACALRSFDILEHRAPRSYGNDHDELAEHLHVPLGVVHHFDWVFESLPDDRDARLWSLGFFDGLTAGLDTTELCARVHDQLVDIMPLAFIELLARLDDVAEEEWLPYRAPDGLGIPAAGLVALLTYDQLHALAMEQCRSLERSGLAAYGGDAKLRDRFLARYGVEIDDVPDKIWDLVAAG